MPETKTPTQTQNTKPDRTYPFLTKMYAIPKPDSRRTKGCTMVPWRKSFAEAQIDLNLLGKKKGWKEHD